MHIGVGEKYKSATHIGVGGKNILEHTEFETMVIVKTSMGTFFGQKLQIYLCVKVVF